MRPHIMRAAASEPACNHLARASRRLQCPCCVWRRRGTHLATHARDIDLLGWVGAHCGIIVGGSRRLACRSVAGSNGGAWLSTLWAHAALTLQCCTKRCREEPSSSHVVAVNHLCVDRSPNEDAYCVLHQPENLPQPPGQSSPQTPVVVLCVAPEGHLATHVVFHTSLAGSVHTAGLRVAAGCLFPDLSSAATTVCGYTEHSAWAHAALTLPCCNTVLRNHKDHT